jgi:hypothetical protein
MRETPIFDSVMDDQNVDMMPLPDMKTHEQFMNEHGYPGFLDRATAILSGALNPRENPDQETSEQSQQRLKQLKQLTGGPAVPVKKKR